MPDARYSERGVIPAGTVAVTLGIDTQSGRLLLAAGLLGPQNGGVVAAD